MPPKKSDILVCPLDWGIGHASRCIPVIRKLIGLGAAVTIGGSGHALELLRKAFPQLPYLQFPGISVSYPATGSMTWKMTTVSPSILRAIRRENRELERLIDEHHFGAVISDNRFGLWNKRVRTAYLTHQIRIKTPRGLKPAEPWLARFHRSFITRYDECWIPDVQGQPNLSGDLSHVGPLPENVTFIGPLSRFSPYGDLMMQDGLPGPDLLILLSGPEPQRTRLEEIILRQADTIRGFNTIMARGLPGSQDPPVKKADVTAFPHLPDEKLRPLLLGARKILCRSGYSTIMDLACLRRGAVLVPTPGQTEQEYLARYLASIGEFEWVSQAGINLKSVITSNRKPGITAVADCLQGKLESVLREFLRKL